MENYTIQNGLCYLPLRDKYNLCGLPLNKKYRSHFEIIALILEAVKDDGTPRFDIMKHANINCTQLKKFLNSLVEMGFIDIHVRDRRVLCQASERGVAFLRQYRILLGMLSPLQTRSRSLATAYETPLNSL